MKAPVSLRAVIEEIDGLSDELFAYLNPHTGELLTLTTEEIIAAEEGRSTADYPEWQHAQLEKARAVLVSDDYLQLPTQRDIHEYDIIERFCATISDPHLRDLLFDQIQGSGAFRRFKNAINHYGIAEDWYQYRAAALKAIAIEWLNSYHIPYQHDIA